MTLHTFSRVMLLMMAMGLFACSDPAPVVTVEYLLAHPDELKRLQLACRDHRDAVSDRTCALVSEAQHRRFWGDGKARYTPGGPVTHE